MNNAWKICAIALMTPLCAMASFLEPTWARNYEQDPSPSGPYIAKSDPYAAVVTERLFSLDGADRIVETFHQVLENVSGREKSIILSISYDASREELSDVEVYIHRRITWDHVNVEKSSAEQKSKLGNMLAVVDDEVVKPGHRVVLQYTLTSTLAMRPGLRDPLWDYGLPSARVRFVVDSDSFAKGLRMSLMLPQGMAMPASFHKESELVCEADKVPAGKRIGWSYSYTPEWTTRFPCLSIYTESMASLSGYEKGFEKEWEKVASASDKQLLTAEVAKITGGAKTLLERSKAIAAFVQGAIQYDDSNGQGANATIPLPVSETLRSMKADCKGKVLLAQALFKAIGVASRPILVYAGEDYSEIRDPAAAFGFNHVIMAVNWPNEAPALETQLKDGPAKGDVLFDPTSETAGFGEPIPGLEGVQGMLVDSTGGGLFAIHTTVPSVELCRMRVQSLISGDGNLLANIKITDNGCSYATYKAIARYSQDDIRRSLVALLAPHMASISITRCSVTRAWESASGLTEISLSLSASGCLQQMSSGLLLTSPSGMAAALIGLPNGLTPVAPPNQDDKIVLTPPWDYRGHAVGAGKSIEILMETEIQNGNTIVIPPARSDDKPWAKVNWEWQPSSEGSAIKCSAKVEFKRGVWSQDERKAHLEFVDELLTSLYAPWTVKAKQG